MHIEYRDFYQQREMALSEGWLVKINRCRLTTWMLAVEGAIVGGVDYRQRVGFGA